MSSVINTWLYFGDPYSGNYVVPDGYRNYFSWDGIVLRGSAVTLSDQQHDDSGKNYVSYHIKRVRVRGMMGNMNLDYKNREDGRLTVILYKYPVKYKNGYIEYPHTRGFINLEKYILYSDPESILSWGVFNEKMRSSGSSRTPTFDFSLSCNKPFTLGPTDLLCCNVFWDFGGNNFSAPMLISVLAKVVYDLN